MKGIQVRTDEVGIRAWLYDLEADVMEVVWAADRLSVADVQDELQRTRTIAYTTVLTTMGRLFEKALLLRERDGKRYLYRAAMTREEFLQRMADEVFDSLADAGLDSVASLFASRVGSASDEELDRLEELIRRRREEMDR